MRTGFRSLSRLLPLVAFAAATAAPVVIVQGTVSTPNAAEAAASRRAAATIDRLLKDFRLGQVVITDEAVTEAALHGTAVVVLPYNPQLPADERRVLQAFADRGGKLLVFYASDPELAKLMGVALGPYLPMQKEGQWAAYTFGNGAPPHVPARVSQVSRSLRPVTPAAAGVQVIAQWEDRDGVRAAEPAWLRARHGYWMTHIMRDDGDADAKQQLLLALLTDCAPALWESAARGYLAATATFRGDADLARQHQNVTTRAQESPHAQRVVEALAASTAQRTGAEHALAAGQYADAVRLAREARATMMRAYAMTFAPLDGERRAVWDHDGVGLFPGDWPRTMGMLRRFGITDVFANVLWPGAAHFPSDVVPASATLRLHGDQALAGVQAAHAEGLRYHAWKVCWRLDAATPELIMAYRKAGRLQVTDAGETLPWLCPSHPANLQLEKDAIRELVTRYAVDGVHLDYIRYRDSHACFCGGCRERFEAVAGVRVKAWPADVRGGPLQERFESWRAGRITRLVQDVRTFTRRIRPDLQISAAVYGRYPLCVRSVGQDWGRWLKEDFVDFVCPMNYTTRLDDFTAWTRQQTVLPAAGGRIWPGIGVSAAESRLDAAAVLDQIAAAREAGAAGFALFDLNAGVAQDILPLLALGATRTE